MKFNEGQCPLGIEAEMTSPKAGEEAKLQLSPDFDTIL